MVSSAGSYYDWFMYSLLCGEGFEDIHKALGVEVPKALLRENAAASVYLGTPEQADFAEVEEAQAKDDDSFALLREKIGFVYPFADCVSAVAKTSVSDIVGENRDPSYDFRARPAFLSGKGLTPAQRGTATHKFMQFADYDSAAMDLDAELSRLVDMGFASTEEAAAMQKKELCRFFGSELFLRMQKAELFREMRFMTERQIGAGEYDSTVVQGVIDCVIVESDGITVLDFKTDRVTQREELIKRYAPQLEIYAEACERLYNKPVKEKLIYSFALGETIKI